MSLASSLKELRRATYIGKDFNTYVTEVAQFIKQQFGQQTFNDFVEADLGIMFLELVAFANSTLSFYLDVQSGESYLDTAKLRNSVVQLTRNIGFKMTGAVPATAAVEISQTLPKAFDVPIAAGTQLTSKPGFVFETTSNILFKKIRTLTGTFILTKNSNIVQCFGDNIANEVLFGPNGEAETVIKLENDLDTAYQRVIALNTAASPHQIITQAPFLPSIFPANIVFLQNELFGAFGNVPITETVANPGFVVSGMVSGSPTFKAIGSITAVIGSLLVDGETFTISDGFNPPKTFEFDNNATTLPGNIPVVFNSSMTVAQVTTSILNAINSVTIGLQVTATHSVISSGANPLTSGDVGPKTVVVREGQTMEETFLSNGQPNQFYRLQQLPDTMMISEGTAQVFISNVPWAEVKFIDFQQADIFEAQLASVPPLVRFGDGVSGNVPQENADVRVTYFATDGVNGNIPSDQITAFRFPVVVNFQSVPDIQVSQPDPSAGGVDFFSISKAKALAPFVFKSLDRAVTEEDYTALSNTFTDVNAGAVGKARAIVVRTIEDDFVLQNFLNQMVGLVPNALIQNIKNYWNGAVSGSCEANIVQIGVLTLDANGRYRAPSAGLLQGLTNFLNDRKEATVDVLAFDGSSLIIPLDLNIEIELEVGFTTSALVTSVQGALTTFLRTLNFGDPVRLGDLYQVVEAVDGVKFSRISFIFPVDPGSGIPIPGSEPAYFDETDLVIGKLQIVEPRNLNVFFLG